MLGRILAELKGHIPFTVFGALTGVALMAFIVLVDVSSGVSEGIFHTLHPTHVVLSALVTTAMFRKYGSASLVKVLLVGYFGAIGVATLSDAILPYLGGAMLGLDIEFEVPFIAEWWLVNPAAFLGIAIGYFLPHTRLPHSGHVLISTWASALYFTAFAAADFLPLLPIIFVFLFLAVWLPCCVSDIVFPLLFVGRQLPHHHS